ncbi:MAG: VPLPA-CTERM sorting domain-containing protein [Methylococcales bacterium]|nr:VPLPA-CTERM sorting domain-containing protein [Methylococcales bacterium]
MKNKLFTALLFSVFLSGVARADLFAATTQSGLVTLDAEFLAVDQSDWFGFDVTTGGDVNLYTSSFAPYDPTLTLWKSTSSTVDWALADPTTGWTSLGFNNDTTTLSFFETGVNAKDAQLKLTLDAGIYFARVSGQSQLFTYQLNIDTNNVAGTGALVTNVAAVPLPAAVWMFASGLIGFLGFSKRKAQNKSI